MQNLNYPAMLKWLITLCLGVGESVQPLNSRWRRVDAKLFDTAAINRERSNVANDLVVVLSVFVEAKSGLVLAVTNLTITPVSVFRTI